MLQNDISQKRIMLNTLMARDKNTAFEIEEALRTKRILNSQLSDTPSISKNRSDVKAIEKPWK
jgi:hypothetical protein